MDFNDNLGNCIRYYTAVVESCFWKFTHVPFISQTFKGSHRPGFRYLTQHWGVIFVDSLWRRHEVEVELNDSLVVWLWKVAYGLAICVLLSRGKIRHRLFFNYWIVVRPCFVDCSLLHEALTVESCLRKKWNLDFFNDIRNVMFCGQNGVVRISALVDRNTLISLCWDA